MTKHGVAADRQSSSGRDDSDADQKSQDPDPSRSMQMRAVACLSFLSHTSRRQRLAFSYPDSAIAPLSISI